MRTEKEILEKKNYDKIYYLKNKDKFLERSKQRRLEFQRHKVKHWLELHRKHRLKAMMVVGKGKLECSNCGLRNQQLLEINHMNGGGGKEIRDFNNSWAWYGAIIKGNRKTDDLDLKCKLCNWANYIERKYGVKYKIIPEVIV